MNLAYGNAKGDPSAIDFARLLKQCNNVGDELDELYISLENKDAIGARDALCDILVFSIGGLHFAGSSDFLDPIPEELLSANNGPGGDRQEPDFGSLLSAYSNISGAFAELTAHLELEAQREPGPTTVAQSFAAITLITRVILATFEAYSFTGGNVVPDMTSVYESNMSKFIKDEADLEATRAKYEGLGLLVQFEDAFPMMRCRCLADAVGTDGEQYRANKVLKSASYKLPVFA